MAATTTGAIGITGSGLGIFTIGTILPASLSIGDFAVATGFALLGTAARLGMDASDARKRHLVDPVAYPDKGYIDTAVFAYAAMGAPLVGAVTFAGCRALNVVPDFAILPLVMVMGYWGRGGIEWILSLVRSVVNKRAGGGEP